MNGIIIINKESGCTSRDTINELTRELKTKKIGHTGTLDPLATGVLITCIGEATKLVELITSEEKEYIAGLRLGINTDTLDITGNIIEKNFKDIEDTKIHKVITSMKGKYLQEVPKYSAVKINGKKLYEYARENIDVELPKRQVEIKNIEIVSDIVHEKDSIEFKIKCTVSKGTYIRSLVRDIANKLNTIGVMTTLTRTKQGKYGIEQAYKLEDIKKSNYKMISIKDYLKDMYTIEVDEQVETYIRNGRILENRYTEEKILFVDTKGEPLAIYKIYDKDNTKIKPYKMLGGTK